MGGAGSGNTKSAPRSNLAPPKVMELMVYQNEQMLSLLLLNSLIHLDESVF
jgi:hypothetical protein